jgi:hypothetical protein
MRGIKSSAILIRFAVVVMLSLAQPFVLNAMASSEEGVHGGGGDICEDRIKQIRDDIKFWIYKGGAQGLSLPSGISLDQYAGMMLDQMKAARVRCVGAGDTGYPVMFKRTPKVCVFTRRQAGSQITCDYVKFLATGDSDQYVLIHHEYAGLAGAEVPNQDDSRYDISNQISSQLEEQIVKKLAVKPARAELKEGVRVVIEDDEFWPRAALVTAVSSDKIAYDRIRLFGENGQWGSEQLIEKSFINGIEVSSLNNVRKGQRVECKNSYGAFYSAFEGRVAHVYSNGFVEVEAYPKSDNSQSRVTQSPLWERNYWSSVPNARAVPRAGYSCTFN